MSTIAIIPARGGSRRIPRKNVRRFLGKPIIAYSIETAIASKLFDRVIVSTEDQDIAGIATIHGAEFMLRPKFLAGDETGTQEVMRHAMQKLPECDLACCIYATSPLMDPADLTRGWHQINRHGVLYALSVGYPPLQDAAQFYWGKAFAFRERFPLVTEHTVPVIINNYRICDINVEADWIRAEQMYAALQGLKETA